MDSGVRIAAMAIFAVFAILSLVAGLYCIHQDERADSSSWRVGVVFCGAAMAGCLVSVAKLSGLSFE